MAVRAIAPANLQRNGSFLNLQWSWTIMKWVRPDTSTPGGGDYRLYFFQGLPAYVQLASDNGMDNVILSAWDGATYHDTSVALPLNTWTHLAITHNACTHVLSLYVNSVLAGSFVFDITTASFTTTTQYGLGGNPASLNDYNEAIAYDRIFQRCFPATLIADEMNSATPVHLTGLLADNPLNDITDLTDASGHGHTYTAPSPIFTSASPTLPGVTAPSTDNPDPCIMDGSVSSCSGGGEVNVVADPPDGQPFTGRDLKPESWIEITFDV
jgi:hypothetical protein